LIRFERGQPIVRPGEIEIAGRRVALRAVPFAGDAGPPPFRFDPVTRMAVLRRSEGLVEAGPDEPEAWRRPISRAPAGPALIGPSVPAELVRRAARAAAEAAREAGRAVYLLDPDPDSLPAAPCRPFVSIFTGIPAETLWSAVGAASAQMPAGLLLPILPGWTSEESYLTEVLDRAAQVGASFVAGVAMAGGGEARRRIVAARALFEPGTEDAFFDRVHHCDWDAEVARALLALRAGARSRGLSDRPPRPRGDGEPAGNAAVAARLEELAETDAGSEHRQALLRAAVRWLDERGRDLRPVVAEGNFRKIFPFGAEIAPEVERAFASLP